MLKKIGKNKKKLRIFEGALACLAITINLSLMGDLKSFSL